MPFLRTLKDTAKIELYRSETYDFVHSAIILYKDKMTYFLETASCAESGIDSGIYNELDGILNFYSLLNRNKDSIQLAGQKYMDMTGTKCIKNSGRLYQVSNKKLDSNSCLIRTGLYEDKKYFLNGSGDGYVVLIDSKLCKPAEQGYFKNFKLFNGKEYDTRNVSDRIKFYKNGNIVETNK